MKNAPRVKRDRLVLVAVVTLAIIAGIWFGLIRFQDQRLEDISQSKQVARRKLGEMKSLRERAGKMEADLANASSKLATVEDGMAAGDLLSWTINTLRRFKLAYKVEIPQFSQIDGPRDTTAIAGFPYHQATLTVAGTGSFHELGRFIADFENQFPYIRLQNLSLEPSLSLNGEEKEKLSFRMDIVTLVKPGRGE